MDLLFFLILLVCGLILFSFGKVFENKLFVFVGAVLFFLLGLFSFTGISYDQLNNVTISENVTNFFSNQTFDGTPFLQLDNSTIDLLKPNAYNSIETERNINLALGLVFSLIGLYTILSLAISVFREGW